MRVWSWGLMVGCTSTTPQTTAETGEPTEGVEVQAGVVSTLVPDSGAGDDLTWHPDGFLVASDPLGAGTLTDPEGTRLVRLQLDGSTSTLQDGLRLPLGNTVGPDGALYACEWGPAGSLFRADTSGDVREVATGIGYASNVVAFADGRVWVTAWSDNALLEIATDGTARTVVELDGPVGMAEASLGGAYVGSANSGVVWHVSDDGTRDRIGRVEASGSVVVADLVEAVGGVYATSFGGHQVWRITAGEATVFAGHGTPGTTDGPALEAAFDQPNGIAASPDGRTLYVQQLDGAVRVIPIVDAA